MQKTEALKLLKEYYVNYYNQYAATLPERVKHISYFLDWLKTAPESSVTVCSDKEFSIRACEFSTQLHGFKTSGDVEYTRTFNATYNAYVVSDPALPEYMNDCHYSAQADSDIVPAGLSDIAIKEGKKVFKANYPDFTYYDEKCRLLNYNISSPEKEVYTSCAIMYPFKDKQLILNFIIFGGKCFLGKNHPKTTGGCYVATCVYGSYDCPEVWTLRRYRDQVLGKNIFGRAFIRLYYAISPSLVKHFGNKNWFRSFCRKKLDKKITKLQKNGLGNTPYDDING